MNAPLHIDTRTVRLDDAADIVGILNPIIEAGLYTALDTTYSVDAERAFIQAFPDRGVFQVAVRRFDNRVVGLQTMEPFASYTRAFDHVGVIGTYVDLRCVRQGIGRQLFAATFAEATGKGYEKIFTYVRADNKAALAAYCAQGFSVIGTASRHARIAGRYIDEVLIEKMLAGTERDGHE